MNHVHIFGTRATNSLHISWFQVFPKRAVPGYGVVGTEDLGIMGLPNGKEKLGTPEFRFTNFNFLGSTGDTLFFELQNSNGLVNVASVISGRHNIKFGGEARLIRTDNFQPNPGNTRWTFSNHLHGPAGLCRIPGSTMPLSCWVYRLSSATGFSRTSSDREVRCMRCSFRTISA